LGWFSILALRCWQSGLNQDQAAIFFGRTEDTLFHFADRHEDPMKLKPRHHGHLVHLQDSQSGGWFILRDDAGAKFFAHRKSLLDPTAQPALGWNVSFTVLPPLPGQPLQRATEIQITKSSRGGQITVSRADGETRLVLRTAGREKVIGELQL
jgi:hypothetical protein